MAIEDSIVRKKNKGRRRRTKLMDEVKIGEYKGTKDSRQKQMEAAVVYDTHQQIGPEHCHH